MKFRIFLWCSAVCVALPIQAADQKSDSPKANPGQKAELAIVPQPEVTQKEIVELLRQFTEESPNAQSAAQKKQPRRIHMVNPAYPEALRRSAIKGVVVVQFVVAANGLVTHAEAIASPHPALSASAIDAIRKWRFEPGERDGKPANFLLRVPITFDIPPQKKA